MADENEYAEVVDEDQNVETEPEVQVTENEDPEPEGQATEDAQAGATAHDERIAFIAERIAAFVAKGEEVMASFNARADDAGAEFDERAAKASAQIESFMTAIQTQVEAAANQFAADLEAIVKGVDGRNASAGVDVEMDEEPAPAPYQPQFTEAAQAFRDRMQVGAGSDLLLTDPEFVERFANFAFDDVPTDVDLPDRTRFMCWLATLLGCQGIDEFRALLPAALNIGLEPETVKEIVYQAVAYLGIGRVYPFLKVTNEVLVAAGVELPLKSQATTLQTEESRYEGGEQAQVACFGEQMHGYKDRGAADYPHIAQWLVKNCFGDWYTRGGLTIAERELMTFCYLAAQGGCEAQLKAHTAGNVQCGNDREFLIKVVSNNVPFIGYPRTLNAMAVVEEVTGAEK